MNGVILTKASTDGQVKAYFERILSLSKSNDTFPVNLDEVWPLVYERKDKAVNELLNTKNEDGSPRYIQDVDYQASHQMVQAGPGLSKKIIYKLSVPCMEWFIARKVRPVFDVYRQVFHQAARPMTAAEMLLQNAKLLVEQEQRLSDVEDEVRQLKARYTTRMDYYAVAGYASLLGIHVNIKQASLLGIKASKLCRERGIEAGRLPDPRFGEVNTYPVDILEEVFEHPIN